MNDVTIVIKFCDKLVFPITYEVYPQWIFYWEKFSFLIDKKIVKKYKYDELYGL